MENEDKKDGNIVLHDHTLETERLLLRKWNDFCRSCLAGAICPPAHVLRDFVRECSAI